MPINESIRTIFVKKSYSQSLSSPKPTQQVIDKHLSYLCSYCPKTFSSPSHLSRHILIHTGEKPCLCSECGQQFSQISSLERHQRTKHRKDKTSSSSNIHLYQCKLCHEYFSLKHNLKMHERKLHQIVTSFFCNICSAYFTCNSSLQKHRNFRHRSLIKNQSKNIEIQPSTVSDHEQITTINNVSDNWSIAQNNEIDSRTNTFDSSATPTSNPTRSERASYFSSEISSINSNNLFNSNNTNTHSYQQQQVYYQTLKWDEMN